MHPIRPSQVDHDWVCPECDATVDHTLGCCWRCGTTADGQRDAAFLIQTTERDPTDDHATPDTHVERRRRRWLGASLASWLLGLPVGMLIHSLHITQPVLSDIASLFATALTLAAVACPAGYLYWVYRQDA